MSKKVYPYALFADIKSLPEELADYLALYNIKVPQWRLDYFCKLLTEKYENKDGSFDYFPFLYRLPGLIRNDKFSKEEQAIRDSPIEKKPEPKPEPIKKRTYSKVSTPKVIVKKAYKEKVIKEDGKVRYIYPTSNRDYYSEKITKLMNRKGITRSEAIQYLDNLQLKREAYNSKKEQDKKDKQQLKERFLMAFERLNDGAMDKKVKLVHVENLSVTYFDRVVDAAAFLDISSQAIWNAFKRKNILNRTYIVRIK